MYFNSNTTFYFGHLYNVTPQFNKVQLPTGHINLINRTARRKKGVSDFLGPIFVFRGLKWTQLAPVTMAD